MAAKKPSKKLLHKARAFQIALQNDILTRIEHMLHVPRIGGTSTMVIHLLLLIVLHAHELIQEITWMYNSHDENKRDSANA